MKLPIQNVCNQYNRIYYSLRKGKDLIIREDSSFYPYYYQKTEDGKFIGIDGTKLTKVCCKSQSDIRAGKNKDSWEADLSPIKRWMLDNVDEIEYSEPKYILFDIEVKADKEFPSEKEAKYPITFITTYCNFTNEYKSWDYRNFKNERVMLEDFCDYIREEKIDCLLAWNIMFDYETLYRRLPGFAKKISPIGQETMGEGEIMFPSLISILDMLALDYKYTLGKRESYALDEVFADEFETEEWGEHDFKDDDKTLAKNKYDVERCQKLMEKHQYLDFFNHQRIECSCFWHDLPPKKVNYVWQSNNSKALDMLFLKEARRLGVILPSKQEDQEREEYDGADRDILQKGLITEPVGVYDLGCYDAETELLTSDGWKKYNELTVGINVASFNIKNSLVEFQPLLYIHKYDVINETMYAWKSDRIDQMVTWNHKMLYKQLVTSWRGKECDPNAWQIRMAKDLTKMHTLLPLSAEVNRNIDYPISDELLEIIAWIITDGWAVKNKKKDVVSYAISQSFNVHPHFVKRIDDAFEKLGWVVSRRLRKRILNNKLIHNLYTEEVNWRIPIRYISQIQLEDNYKVIPLWMLQKLSIRQLKKLYEYLNMGDGDKNRDCYYAINVLARDRFQYLCALIGRASVNNTRKEVYCCEEKYCNISLIPKQQILYTGVVWCPTVANGFVVVRRNGRAFISGNSAYPTFLVDLCLDPANLSVLPDNNTVKIDILARETNEYVRTYYFKQNPDAIVPTVARKLLKSKQDLKDELNQSIPGTPEYKKIEVKYAIKKALTNSLYGILANPYFRLHSRAVSETDTFLVRKLLKYIREELIKNGTPTIYYDTDASMVLSGENISDKLNQWIEMFGYDNFNKSLSIRFEHQGIFKSLFLLAMCRYVGDLQTPKGLKREVKGLQLKRRDASTFTKEYQGELLEKILANVSLDEVIQFILKEMERIKTAPLIDIATPCKINKNIEDYKKKEIFFRGLENTKKILPTFEKEVGQRFYWIYTTNEDDVICLDKNNYKHVTNVDYKEMMIKNIFNVSVPIFKGMNWGKELLELCEKHGIQLESAHRNTLLEDYENYAELKEYYSARTTKKRLNPEEVKKPRKSKKSIDTNEKV